MNWQLNKIQYPVYNLGEGRRIGIWVQGCTLRCKGCVNKTLWSRTKGKSIPVLDLFNWIFSLHHDYNGITISGGEPFQQYEQLISFLHMIKMKTSLSVNTFTGYYLNELNELFPDRLFVKYIDDLIDGRYIESQHENKNIKGSSNQTLYKFINGIPFKQEENNFTNKWSIKISDDNQIYMAGIPKKDELQQLSDRLATFGILKHFK